MSMPGKLVLSRDGCWRHDGDLVTHQGVSSYFNRYLRYSEVHRSYVLEVDGKCVSVEVEDAPYFVLSLHQDEAKFYLSLSNQKEEVLDLNTLSIGVDNSIYCLVQAGQHLARFSRSAYQGLIPYIQEEDGAFYLNIAGKSYPIKQR